MSIVYVGLDLGSSNFQQVALNHDGVSRVNRGFRTSEGNLVKAFSDLKGEIHVHVEAGELAPWAASIITPLVERVVCSHPQSNAWIAKDADKCDRVDAYKLAELLRLNRFKEVHYAADQPRPWLFLSPPLPTPLSLAESSANGSRVALTPAAIHRLVVPCHTPDPLPHPSPRPLAAAALLPPPTAPLSRTSGRNSSLCASTHSSATCCRL